MKKISTPLDKSTIRALKAGQELLLSGEIYTARDQAHKRIAQAIKKGARLPIDLKSAVIYYCGPTQRPKGKVIGSCGPTTSSRMDALTPLLLAKGLKAMIGKGRRSEAVRNAIKKYKGVYFVTYAGCGALLAGRIKKSEAAAHADLGPEAILRLEVRDFPLIVAIDANGRSIYGKG